MNLKKRVPGTFPSPITARCFSVFVDIHPPFQYNCVALAPARRAGAGFCVVRSESLLLRALPQLPRYVALFGGAGGEVKSEVCMQYAIVESGGKQYKAVPGGTIEVDRLPHEEGAQIELERVLLVADGDAVQVGNPTVPGAKVKATVEKHFKGRKVIVFKYIPRERYRRKRGHRQQYTRLRIDAIEA